jgi:hypothetical protein
MKIKDYLLLTGFGLLTIINAVKGQPSNNLESNVNNSWTYVGKSKHKSIPYEEFMSADSTLMQGIDNVALHSNHTFVDPQGNSREIYLAIATSYGNNFFNYIAHTNFLNPGDKEILENVVNSCGGFINTDTTSSIDIYKDWVTITLNECDIPVSINEINSNNTLTNYPNPTLNDFFVTSTTANINQLRIYNTAGQEVYREDNINKNLIHLQQVLEKPGLYIIRAITDDGQIISSKQVKQ